MVQTTSICLIRRRRGNVSPSWNVTMLSAIIAFFVAGRPTSNVVVHQYTLHIFGAKHLPICANYALQHTASDNAKQYTEAARALLENFYMDDYLDSVESPERDLIWSKELVHLLHLVGFKLTKFVSNVPDLADRIDWSAQSTEPKVIV